MDDAVNLAFHHLAVEVEDVVTGFTACGAELLKHLGERNVLTKQMLLINLLLNSYVTLLAGLALAQEEELVVLIDGCVEHGTHLIGLTDAQTVGQQLD